MNNQRSQEETSGKVGRHSGVDRLPVARVGTRIKALLLTPVLIVVTLGVGWLVWSIVEWCSGRNPSYRLTKLRVVRTSDGKAIGLGRAALREVCCALLLVPMMIACLFIGLSFAMGASPPEGVLGQTSRSPWDWLTRTEVVDEGQSHGP